MSTKSHHGRHSIVTNADDISGTTSFDYLFEDLQSMPSALLPEERRTLNKLYDSLDKLGESMVPMQLEPNDSQLPPILTYWGQFIDHDITLNTDRNTVVSKFTQEDPPRSVVEIKTNLINGRQPFLNLDSLYGREHSFDPENPSPENVLYNKNNPAKFIIGFNQEIPGQTVPPQNDLRRDLHRDPEGTAIIADARNDENLIIAQFHLAWLRFHNAMVDAIEQKLGLSGKEAFEKARDVVRFHYQWLTVNKYLVELTMPGTVDEALNIDPNTTVVRNGEVFTPLEFSVAAFRFGHSMIREKYDFNRNFGRGSNPTLDRATLDLLFQFTGGGGLGFPDSVGFDPNERRKLPSNWIIEWDRFIKVTEADRSARRVDTNLNPLLGTLRNEGNEPDTPFDIAALQKQLAKRNLRRGFQLRMPTGQSAAIKMGITPLTKAEMLSGNEAIADALQNGNFVHRTPLWFYILKEAEVQNEKGGLGKLGSKIVAQTIIGLIKEDEESYS